MTVIAIGKIKKVEPIEKGYRVLIQTQKGEVYLPITKRAMWDWCYLHFGKKETIKKAKEQLIQKVFIDGIKQVKEQRELQYIIGNSGKIIAVATIKHATHNEDQITQLFNNVLKENLNLTLTEVNDLEGKIAFLEKTKIAKIGLQFYAGLITTYRAIKICGISEIIHCLNPISFLKVERGLLLTNKDLFGEIPTITITIKRYEKISEIKQRFEEAMPQIEKIIKLTKSEFTTYEKYVNQEITKDEAIEILSAFGYSYQVNKTALLMSLDRFENIEKEKYGSTIWALAMATSWVARHSKAFRVSLRRQTLATMSGAITLIKDVKKVVKAIKQNFRNNPYYHAIKKELRGEKE